MHRKLFHAASVALALTACSPSDLHSKSVRERLENDQAVVFNQPGYLRPSCRARGPWREARLSSETVRTRLITGQQRLLFEAGLNSCYQLGSEVEIRTPDSPVSAGRLRIREMILVRQAVAPRILSAMDPRVGPTALEQLREANLELRSEHKDLITIVVVTYVPGSASDEGEVVRRAREAERSDLYEETTSENVVLPGCSSVWSVLTLPVDILESVRTGRISSWYRMGRENCLRQGDVVVVKRHHKDPQVLGQARILKVKRLRLHAARPSHFRLQDEMDFVSILERIHKEKSEEMLTIVDFDWEAP